MFALKVRHMDTRELVDYSDIFDAQISDDQYHSNLLNQLRDPKIPVDTPIKELENMCDFVPLATDEYRMTFCVATRELPELCQVKIWDMVRRSAIPNPPNAPHKGISPRMQGFIKRWKSRKPIEF